MVKIDVRFGLSNPADEQLTYYEIAVFTIARASRLGDQTRQQFGKLVPGLSQNCSLDGLKWQ